MTHQPSPLYFVLLLQTFGVRELNPAAWLAGHGDFPSLSSTGLAYSRYRRIRTPPRPAARQRIFSLPYIDEVFTQLSPVILPDFGRVCQGPICHTFILLCCEPFRLAYPVTLTLHVQPSTLPIPCCQLLCAPTQNRTEVLSLRETRSTTDLWELQSKWLESNQLPPLSQNGMHPYALHLVKSGRWDLNPRPRPSKGRALPAYATS